MRAKEDGVTGMRKKELRAIITFHITADAMAADLGLRKKGVPGRLIPVPRSISASCGLSWSAPPDARGEVLQALKELDIEPEGVCELSVLV